MLLLALVSVLIGAVSDCAWGFAASAERSWFAGSPRRFEIVGGAGGLAMIGLMTINCLGQPDHRILCGKKDQGSDCCLEQCDRDSKCPAPLEEHVCERQ